MIDSKNLKLIVNEASIKRRLRFQGGLITKTRLMGVIALKLHWLRSSQEHYVQWFLLDAEEHGIYDYLSIHTLDIDQTDKYTEQFLGALGGERIPITQKDAFFLIQQFSTYNKKFKKIMPKASEYRFILDYKIPRIEGMEDRIMGYISEKVDDPIQLINLFMMRLVARDHLGIHYLLSNHNLRPIPSLGFGSGGTLLKNVIKPAMLSGVFRCESIIEIRGQYYLVFSTHEVIRENGEFRIKSFRQRNKVKKLNPEAVAYAIQYPETLQIYRTNVTDSTIIEGLIKHLNNSLRYEFNQGTMVVEFHERNQHTYEEVYYLGRDIKGIYFLNHFQQLILCSYRPQEEKRNQQLMDKPDFKGQVERIFKHQAPGSIIYEYAEGETMDFFEYLEELK
ncbi:hypothetical protein [Alkaliphilus crotonatoxidans]